MAEAGGVQCFLIYNRRAPSDPINLGAVFTKTVSYDFSNKYIFQSDGVLFRLNASRSRHLSTRKIHRGGNGAGTKLRQHKNLCKHVVIYGLRKRKGMGEEDVSFSLESSDPNPEKRHGKFNTLFSISLICVTHYTTGSMRFTLNRFRTFEAVTNLRM